MYLGSNKLGPVEYAPNWTNSGEEALYGALLSTYVRIIYDAGDKHNERCVRGSR